MCTRIVLLLYVHVHVCAVGEGIGMSMASVVVIQKNEMVVAQSSFLLIFLLRIMDVTYHAL